MATTKRPPQLLWANWAAPRYPEWDAFQNARRRLDPRGRFSNPYLDRVIGRISG